jgi:protein-disulfide isomerase
MDDKNSYMMIPGAIIIGALIISGAIIYSNNPSTSGGSNADQKAAITDDSGNTQEPTNLVDKMKPVTGDDHIRGSIDAPIKIIEFSDTECPFCKRFHETMQQVVDEYDGKVAWVYRHFPLESLHPKAPREAQATECAAELGGNAKFWAYLDRLMEITPSNNGLDDAELPKIAGYVGLNTQAFLSCLDSGRHKGIVDENLKDALDSGGLGTPYSILIGAGGKKSVINGAQPYSNVKAIVDSAL